MFALASRQPLVIVLDDMQWADPASALLMQQLVFAAGSRAGPVRLLLAIAARPADDDRSAAAALRRIVREPIVRRLPLGPLSDAGVGEFVSALSGRPPGPAELHDIIDRTGGSAAEVIRHADAAGLLAVVAAAQWALELMGAEDRGSLISRVVLITDVASSRGSSTASAIRGGSRCWTSTTRSSTVPSGPTAE